MGIPSWPLGELAALPFVQRKWEMTYHLGPSLPTIPMGGDEATWSALGLLAESSKAPNVANAGLAAGVAAVRAPRGNCCFDRPRVDGAGVSSPRDRRDARVIANAFGPVVAATPLQLESHRTR